MARQRESLRLFQDTLDHGNPLGNHAQEVLRKWRARFSTDVATLRLVGSDIPGFQGVSSRLGGEARRPSQNVATLAFA